MQSLIVLKNDSFYCVGGGASVSGECSVGYYCPTNISNPLQKDVELKTVGSSGPKQVTKCQIKQIIFKIKFYMYV